MIFSKVMDKKFFIACFDFRKLNIVLRSSVFTKMVRCFHVTVTLKARLHRRFLSRKLVAIFVARMLQLQNRTCKPGAVFSAICRRDIAGVSNMFVET